MRHLPEDKAEILERDRKRAIALARQKVPPTTIAARLKRQHPLVRQWLVDAGLAQPSVPRKKARAK